MVVRAHEALSTDALAELAHALSSAAAQPTRAAALAAVAQAARTATDADVAIVRVQTEADQLEAYGFGVQGVPFFLMAGVFGVSGAQPIAVLEQALQTAVDDQG